jgi:hypothetical protein
MRSKRASALTCHQPSGLVDARDEIRSARWRIARTGCAGIYSVLSRHRDSMRGLQPVGCERVRGWGAHVGAV